MVDRRRFRQGGAEQRVLPVGVERGEGLSHHLGWRSGAVHQGRAEHERLEDPEDLMRLAGCEPGPGQGSECRLHRGPASRRVRRRHEQQRHRVRVRHQRPPEGEPPLLQIAPPPRGGGRILDFAEDPIGNPGQQVRLTREVPIQRHRLHGERLAQAPHRQFVEPTGVDQVEGRLDHPLASEPGLLGQGGAGAGFGGHGDLPVWRIRNLRSKLT